MHLLFAQQLHAFHKHWKAFPWQEVGFIQGWAISKSKLAQAGAGNSQVGYTTRMDH